MRKSLRLDYDRPNYRSVVLAGLGTVGKGILTVGKDCLQRFESVFLLDINSDLCEIAARQFGYPVRQMNLEDTTSLMSCLSLLTPPVLLVNVCTGIDTIQLREALADFPVGYIDISESRTPDNPQGRFTKSMPYTNQACHGKYPHLICQGSNPGVVEYIARMLMDQMGAEETGYSVTIFENDQLAASDSDTSRLVSWSPRDLIDEVMTTPLIEFTKGELTEGPSPVAKRETIQWAGRHYQAFKVGHEDIWNLGNLKQVSDTAFYYGFCDDVTDVLQTEFQQAQQVLRLPLVDEAIKGLERLVVSVEHSTSGSSKSVLWELDHAQTKRDYGLNAVQYQTALSTLFSMTLMQCSDVGRCPGTFNASTLPLAAEDFEVLSKLMNQLGIFWQQVPKGYVLRLEKAAI